MIRALQRVEVLTERAPVLIQKPNLDPINLDGKSLNYQNLVLEETGRLCSRKGFEIIKQATARVFWRNFPFVYEISNIWEAYGGEQFLIYFFMWQELQTGIEYDGSGTIRCDRNIYQKLDFSPRLKIVDTDIQEDFLIDNDADCTIQKGEIILKNGELLDAGHLNISALVGMLGSFSNETMIVEPVDGYTPKLYRHFQHGLFAMGDFYLCTGVAPLEKVVFDVSKETWSSKELHEEKALVLSEHRTWSFQQAKGGKTGFVKKKIVAYEDYGYLPEPVYEYQNFVPNPSKEEIKRRAELNQYKGKVRLDIVPAVDAAVFYDGATVLLKNTKTQERRVYTVLRAKYQKEKILVEYSPSFISASQVRGKNLKYEFTYNRQHPNAPNLWTLNPEWVALKNEDKYYGFQQAALNIIRMMREDEDIIEGKGAGLKKYGYLNESFYYVPTYLEGTKIQSMRCVPKYITNKEFEPNLTFREKVELFYELPQESIPSYQFFENKRYLIKETGAPAYEIDIYVDKSVEETVLLLNYMFLGTPKYYIYPDNEIKYYSARQLEYLGDEQMHAYLTLDVAKNDFFRGLELDTDIEVKKAFLDDWDIYLDSKAPNLVFLHNHGGYYYGVGTGKVTDQLTKESKTGQTFLYRTITAGDPSKWYDIARDTYFFQTITDFFPQNDKIVSITSNQGYLYIIGLRYTQIWQPTNLPYKGLIKEQDKEQVKKEKIDIFGKYITTIECGCSSPDCVFILENCVALLNTEGLYVFDPFTFNGIPELKKLAFNNEWLTSNILEKDYTYWSRGHAQYFLGNLFLRPYKGGDTLFLQIQDNTIKFCSVYKSLFLTGQYPIHTTQASFKFLSVLGEDIYYMSQDASTHLYYDGADVPIKAVWEFSLKYPRNKVWRNSQLQIGLETEDAQNTEGLISIRNFTHPLFHFEQQISFPPQADEIKGEGVAFTFSKNYKQKKIQCAFFGDAMSVYFSANCYTKTNINNFIFEGVLTDANK